MYRRIRYPAAVGQASQSLRAGAPWSDRIFAALPVAPIWLGVGFAVALLLAFALLSAALGDFAEFLAGEESLLQARDARLGVIIVILAAFLPTAHRYAMLGARRNLGALRPLIAPGSDGDAVRLPFHRRRIAALLGLLLPPLVGLSVDRDPGLYLRADYWGVEQIWTWSLGAFCGWNLGVFIDTTFACSRRFSEIAARLERIDLLDLSGLAPFARQGLLFALLWVLLPSIFAVNAVDRDFASSIFLVCAVCVVVSTTALLLPVLGVHRRIREAKHEEIGRVEAAIRGDAAALEGSAIAARGSSPSLADLIAYRSWIESRPEWPFDTGMRLRFGLYLAIPLGSWLGGALVERLLTTALE
jgi:hypothetical protein